MRGSLRAPAVRWLALAGPPPDAIAAALPGRPDAAAKLEPLATPGGGRGGRSLRAVLASGELLFAKVFPARPPGRRCGSALARLLRRGAAQRAASATGARARGLAQLNASLPDWIPAALRRGPSTATRPGSPSAPRAGACSPASCPRASARRHHWSGRDCAVEGQRGSKRSGAAPAIVIQRKELEEPGMRPPLPSS